MEMIRSIRLFQSTLNPTTSGAPDDRLLSNAFKRFLNHIVDIVKRYEELVDLALYKCLLLLLYLSFLSTFKPPQVNFKLR